MLRYSIPVSCQALQQGITLGNGNRCGQETKAQVFWYYLVQNSCYMFVFKKKKSEQHCILRILKLESNQKITKGSNACQVMYGACYSTLLSFL